MTTTSCKKEAPSGAFSIEFLNKHVPELSDLELELVMFCLKHKFNNLFIEVRNDIYRYNFKQHKDSNLHILTEKKNFADKLTASLKTRPTHVLSLMGSHIFIFYLPCYPDGFDIQINCKKIDHLKQLLNSSELHDKLNKDLSKKDLFVSTKI